MSPRIACVGAGRMGRGMAIAFAYAGLLVDLIDAKPRPKEQFETLKAEATEELKQTLTMLSGFDMLTGDEIGTVLDRIKMHALGHCADVLATADVIFEGVPETLDAKESAFKLISAHAQEKTIIASTTSTILSNDLAAFVTHPQRFLNAHWLNPAFLVPLVEVSPCDQTDPNVTARLIQLLETVGKVPVECKASPGYIVPRIQALAMNEAARIVEEGVATAQDVDKATKYGFGFRFATLGLLEFIDWGGGDILFHASNYMEKATGSDRFKAPDVIKENMELGRTGLRDGQGFMDYTGKNIPDYQRAKLAAFVAMLRHLDKMPPKGSGD
jgi:3-hydroxybutyryl-CoA dehydrogenase